MIMCEAPDWEASLCKTVRRRARKVHDCYECGKPIAIGAYYFRCSSLTDGSWFGWDQCSVCERVESAHAQAERSMGGSSAYSVGRLREQVRECIQEEPHYVVAFRAAWKGEPAPKKPVVVDRGRYSTVMGRDV
jgi:hypothetical protein